MDTSLITASVALITAIFSIIFTIWRLRHEREQWRKDRDADLQATFLHDLVVERFKTYSEVLKTLGAVRDVPDPKQKHWESLKKNPEQLIPIADALIDHLYGEAGLVMSLNTRNALLQTYYACHLFVSGTISIDKIVDVFFEARRQLRADLQIEDLGKKSDLRIIRDAFAK